MFKLIIGSGKNRKSVPLNTGTKTCAHPKARSRDTRDVILLVGAK